MTGEDTSNGHVVNLGGRPVRFDAEMKRTFLEALSSGLSNAEACTAAGIALPTLHWHVSKDPEFRELYESAKAASVDSLIDKAEAAAERALTAESGAQVAGIKILVDHLWKKASRISPQKWGERPTVVALVNEISSDQELAKRLAFVQALQLETSHDVSELPAPTETQLVGQMVGQNTSDPENR
jgi:AcrR family transcriptional regulator